MQVMTKWYIVFRITFLRLLPRYCQTRQEVDIINMISLTMPYLIAMLLFNRKMRWFALRAFPFRNSLKLLVISCMHQVSVHRENDKSP